MTSLRPLAWTVEPVTHPQANPRLARLFLRAQGPEGLFTLMPQQTLNANHLVMIRFQPALPEGLDSHAALDEYMAMPKDTPAWRRRRAELGYEENELGYVSEVANAIGVIETFRGQPAAMVSDEDLLAQEGFTFAHTVGTDTNPLRIYRRDWKSQGKPSRRGFFSVMLGATRVHLEFEKARGADGCHNLLTLAASQTWENGVVHPLYWPDTLSFQSMALKAALRLANDWEPEQVYDQG